MLAFATPMSHIATIAPALYACLENRTKVTDMVSLGAYAANACTLAHVEKEREQYNRSKTTISRCVSANLSNIKAKLWHPSGNLARAMVQNSSAAKRSRVFN